MSVETFECMGCGAKIGLTGPGSGSDEDLAAEEYFNSEIEYHQSGECTPIDKIEVLPDPRAEYIASLLTAAGLLDSKPELRAPDATMQRDGRLLLRWDVWDGEPAAKIAELTKLIGGKWDKNAPAAEGDYATTYFELSQRHEDVTLVITTYRDRVCERVVTGTREVTVSKPIVSGHEDVTETVEDFEWRCHPILHSAVSS